MRMLIVLPVLASAVGFVAMLGLTGRTAGGPERLAGNAAAAYSQHSPLPASAYASPMGDAARSRPEQGSTFQDPFGSGRAWFSGKPDTAPPPLVYLEPRSPGFLAAVRELREEEERPAIEPPAPPLLQATQGPEPDAF